MKRQIIDLIIKQNNASSKGRLGKLTGTKALKISMQDAGVLDKQELLKEAAELEKEGLIRVKWFDGKSEIREIRYDTADLSQIYRLGGEQPPWETLNEYRMQAEKLLSVLKKSWIREYCEKELMAQLEKGNLPANLKKEHFLDCLKGLDELTSPVYKRLFSIQYLGSSKEFEENLESSVITAAKKYCPEVEEEMDESTVLAQLYVEEYSGQLWIKGSLKLELAGTPLDLGWFVHGVALNAQTLKQVRIAADQKIRTVITVENKANFESMEYREGTLLIFSHGFFAPVEREFLKNLAQILPAGASYYHTGDLDLGGIRIFRYIRTRILPQLQPLQMDCETFRKYKKAGFGWPIKDEKYLESLQKTEEPLLQELKEEIIREKWVIEQESFLII